MPDTTVPKYILLLGESSALSSLPSAGSFFDSEETLDLGGGRVGVPPGSVRRCFEASGYAYGFRTVAHINLKGGVGKTTCAVTAATRAAQYGFRTCILDLDSQASASLVFERIADEDQAIFYDVWQKPAEMVMDALCQIDEYLWILPSSLENGLLDAGLSNPRNQKRAVAGVVAVLRREGFDLVIIDCPPSLGTAVISSICAADIIVIPVGSDPFSFKGLELTLEEVVSISETFGIKSPAAKVLFTKYDKREKLAEEARSLLAGPYRDYALPVTIGVSTDFPKALARRETIFASHRKSNAKQDYDRYVRLLLDLPGAKRKRS